MKQHTVSDTVEFSLGPHSARAGWEVARITYDARNPKHLAQIDAAITAMVKARGERPLDLPPRPIVCPHCHKAVRPLEQGAPAPDRDAHGSSSTRS